MHVHVPTSVCRIFIPTYIHPCLFTFAGMFYGICQAWIFLNQSFAVWLVFVDAKKKTPSALFSPSIPLDLRPFAIKFGQFSGYEYISNVLFYLFCCMAREIRLNPIPFSIYFVFWELCSLEFDFQVVALKAPSTWNYFSWLSLPFAGQTKIN